MNNCTFNSWSYMRTRVVNGEGDNILCIGTTLPDDVIGNIESIPSVDGLPGKTYDLILGQNLLSSQYSTKEHFEKIYNRMKRAGIYALAEPITASADAWLNTLVTTVDPLHVRAPRVEEMLKYASEYFDIIEFLRFETPICYTLTTKEMAAGVKDQIKSMPENILQKLAPVVTGDEIKFNMLMGLFVWQR